MIETTTSFDAKDTDPKDIDSNKYEIKDDAAWVLKMLKYEQMKEKKAGKTIDETKDLLKLPKSIRFQSRDRKCDGCLAWAFYRLLRCLYVSVWFYFSPFVAMSLQFIIPLMQI